MYKNSNPMQEIPLGLLMALAKNPKAQERFYSMSEENKQQIINGTHQVRSKQEMERYVEGIIGY